MKIDRLIGILSVLLQEERVTAPELAKKFEVSRRTINRDIEDLCKAGIPVHTAQGASGGISIMEGYRMDRTLFTSKDMQMILAGLRSLDSVSGSQYYGQLMEKIKAGSSDFVSGRDSILIDLSSWYKDSLAPKIEMIQTAIEERRLISFWYYAPKGESSREIEPYYLIFKWSSWYVWGWCCKREDFRLFKLNRMDAVKMSARQYAVRIVPLPDLSTERIFPGRTKVKAVFQPEMRWRLVEEYGPHCFETQEDGTLLFEREFMDDESLVNWMLSFQAQAEVLEPEEIRKELLKIAENIMGIYKKGEYHMEYKIVKKESFTVIANAETFSYEEAKRTIPQFWQEHFQTGKGEKVMGTYGISIDENMGHDTFEYLIADLYDSVKVVPEGFITKTIPAFTWAVFPCRGAMPDALQDLNDKIFSEWLPACKEYRPAAGYCVEYYDAPSKYAKGTVDEDYYFEIWIPVIQK